MAKQIIILRKDLKMRLGKSVSQGSHASLGVLLVENKPFQTVCKFVYNILFNKYFRNWVSGNFKKICVYVNSEQELLDLHKQAQNSKILNCLILDSGLTEFAGNPTYTALAIGPDDESKIDKITKHLKLL